MDVLEVTRKVIVLSLLPIIILTVEARPSCKLLGELQKDLVCTPGDHDYALIRGLVSDNNRTTGITLRSCKIISVDYESFNGLFGLKYLDLSINKIDKLRLGVLDGAKQVTHLNLSYNLLKELPLGLFDQKQNLEMLDLKGNKINILKLGIFDPLYKLSYLDMSSNDIQGRNLSPFLFDRSTQIRFMDFSRNDMSSSPENLLHAFKVIDFLNLDRCSLTEIPNFALIRNLKTMKHLMLSTNRLRLLDQPATFVNLENLEILNLAENEIESVHEDLFKPLRKLKIILLRNNKLQQLPNTLFQNMAKLGNIDLSHNLIRFVPVDAFRGTALKNLNLADNRFTYLINNFCLELRNSGATLSKFFFNQNPWQCACLIDLLKEVKALGVEYNYVKYNGKQPVCVTTDEFNCKRHQTVTTFYVEMYDNMIHSN